MNTEFFKRIISSSLLIPLAIFFIIKGSYFFIFFMSVFFIVTSYEWYKMSKTKIGIIDFGFWQIFTKY